MSSNLSYTQTGDYLLPNLTLHQPKNPLGKYGRMRLNFLKQQHPVLYHTMLLSGTLHAAAHYSPTESARNLRPVGIR